MKKLAFVLMVAALAVLASWSGGVRAADNSVTVNLGALNNWARPGRQPSRRSATTTCG